MSADVSLEQRITAWMAEEVSLGASGAIVDEILMTTSRMRPQPSWLVLLVEPPMRLDARIAVGSPTRRLALALAAVLLLVAATVAVGAGLLSQRPPIAADWPMFRGSADRSGLVAQGPVGRGVLQWQYRAAAKVTKGIAVVGDLVYVASDDGRLHALDLATGAERWSVNGTGPLSGPAISAGMVFFTDGAGVVHAIDATTGAPRWTSSVAFPGPSELTPAGGAVFFGTSDGALVALDGASGRVRWTESLGPGAGAVHAPSYADGAVFVGTDRAGFVAVDAGSGAPRWSNDTGTDVTGTAVVADGIAFIGAGTDVTTGHLRAVDSATGKLLWQRDGSFGAPSIGAGVAYATNQPTGVVVALDERTGALRWQAQLTGTTRAPAVAGRVVYVPEDSAQAVVALDAATGWMLWQLGVDGINDCCISVAHGLAFVGTSLGSVYAIGGDGSPVTAVALSPPPASAMATGGLAATPIPSFPQVPVALAWKAPMPSPASFPSRVALDPAGRAWVADNATGTFLVYGSDGNLQSQWGTIGSGPGQLGRAPCSIAFVRSGGFFVVCADGRVQAFDASRRFLRGWGGNGTGPGTFSEPVAIAVGPDGDIYVLDDVRGVIEKDDPTGKVLATFAAFPHAQSGENTANAFAMDAVGNMYVADLDPYQVQRFDSSGRPTLIFGSPGMSPGQFGDQPAGLAIDRVGRLYVAQGPGRGDTAPGILVFAPDGSYIGGWGPRGTGDLAIKWPGWGMALDGAGNLYVTDAASLVDPNNPDPSASLLDKFRLLPPLAP